MSKWNKNQMILFVIMLLGNLIIGVGIAIQTLANLGIEPGMTFFYGMSSVFGIPLGVATLLFNCIFFIPLVLFDRKRIGIATIINMFCIGFIVDFCTSTFLANIEITSLVMRIIIMIVGILLQTFGVALYSSSNMGQSPLDGIPNVLVKVTHRMSYRFYRVLQDTILTLIGFSCGIQIGIGTLMLMFMVGPFIHFFQQKIEKVLTQKEILTTISK